MIINFNHLKTFYNALLQKMKGYRGNWEQNDPTADDYIKNRTHWSESTKKIIVKKQTIDGFTVMQEPIYAVVNAFTMEPIIGQTYIINWDGVDYSVVAKEANDSGMIYMGNANYIYMSPGGDIPFAIIFAGGIFIVTESSATSHTITISTIQEVVHKLDKKFIDMPDNIVSEDNIYDILENNLAPVAFTNDYDSLSGKPTDMIRYTAQMLTGDQMEQARANIEAAGQDDLNILSNNLSNLSNLFNETVKHTRQSLTDAQKIQARENIGAGTSDFSGDYNDLDNKLVYTESVDTLILLDSDCIFLGTHTLIEKDYYDYGNNSEYELQVGKIYDVTVGSKTYKLECKTDGPYVYLGNMRFKGVNKVDTGEDICIWCSPVRDGETYEIISYSYYLRMLDQYTSVHVKIVEPAYEIIHKLDEKYIPDTIARTADIPALDFIDYENTVAFDTTQIVSDIDVVLEPNEALLLSDDGAYVTVENEV